MQPFVTHPGAAAQLHRLRLAQELQLDALRLAFSASALDPDRPWRSWMAADLDRAQELAAALAELAADLGAGPAHSGPQARTAADDALADLLVSYRTIATLLVEVLDGNRPLGDGLVRRRVSETLQEVCLRVAELEPAESWSEDRAGDQPDQPDQPDQADQAGRASGAGASGDR